MSNTKNLTNVLGSFNFFSLSFSNYELSYICVTFIFDLYLYIYSFARGLRNPFSLEMNPNTSKDIVEYHVSDVGRSLWEEINIGGTGYEKVNYGWREREGPCEMGRVDSNECAEVDSKEYQDPLYFIPHPDSDGCAIVGGAFVPNGIWPKEFDNEYLYSELRGRGIFHLLSDPENECRGTKCKEQKPAYIPIPIVDNIDGMFVKNLTVRIFLALLIFNSNVIDVFVFVFAFVFVFQ